MTAINIHDMPESASTESGEVIYEKIGDHAKDKFMLFISVLRADKGALLQAAKSFGYDYCIVCHTDGAELSTLARLSGFGVIVNRNDAMERTVTGAKAGIRYFSDVFPAEHHAFLV